MIYCFSKHKETMNILISYVCQKACTYEYVLIPGMSTHQEKSYAILVFLLLLLTNAFASFCTFAVWCDAIQFAFS